MRQVALAALSLSGSLGADILHERGVSRKFVRIPGEWRIHSGPYLSRSQAHSVAETMSCSMGLATALAGTTASIRCWSSALRHGSPQAIGSRVLISWRTAERQQRSETRSSPLAAIRQLDGET
jgi:hypothetical protein